MALAELMAEHQRIAILKLLQESPGYDLNESILQAALGRLGLDITKDRLRTEVSWLAEQDLVSVSTVYDLQVIKLKNRGVDVAHGRVQVPGVKRPGVGKK